MTGHVLSDIVVLTLLLFTLVEMSRMAASEQSRLESMDLNITWGSISVQSSI